MKTVWDVERSFNQSGKLFSPKSAKNSCSKCDNTDRNISHQENHSLRRITPNINNWILTNIRKFSSQTAKKNRRTTFVRYTNFAIASLDTWKECFLTLLEKFCQKPKNILDSSQKTISIYDFLSKSVRTGKFEKFCLSSETILEKEHSIKKFISSQKFPLHK